MALLRATVLLSHIHDMRRESPRLISATSIEHIFAASRRRRRAITTFFIIRDAETDFR